MRELIKMLPKSSKKIIKAGKRIVVVAERMKKALYSSLRPKQINALLENQDLFGDEGAHQQRCGKQCFTQDLMNKYV